MSESCVVCLEDYKGRKTVKVTCQYCPGNACRGCLERYLLQSYEDPHCMECKRGWSTEFMAANFPLCFRNNTLRKHRRQILFEREKALLPAVQEFVTYKKNIEHYTAICSEIKAKLGDCSYEMFHSPRAGNKYDEKVKDTLTYKYTKMFKAFLTPQQKLNIVIKKIKEAKDTLAPAADIALLENQKNELDSILSPILPLWAYIKDEYTAAQNVMSNARMEIYRNQNLYDGNTRDANARREFIMKCPDDGCRGFLSSAYKCGTCSKWACPHCVVVIGVDKDAPHTCDPNTVESAKMIKAETHPCPKCGTRIFKVDGCDQMWCIMDGCHTAFSWNTGHIVTGVVHNPHYYEWLRRNGGGAAPAREVGDIPCGGLPAYRHLANIFRHLANNLDEYPTAMAKNIFETHRNISELINMRLQNYPARPPQLMNKEKDVEYLMNRISEDEWKRQLELQEARFNRRKEIGQILQTMATAGSDMMNVIVNRLQPVLDIDLRTEIGAEAASIIADMVTWLETVGIVQLEQLREFGNDALKTLAKRDRMAVPQFDSEWKWVPTRAIYKPIPVPPPCGGTAKEEKTATEIIDTEVMDVFTAQEQV